MFGEHGCASGISIKHGDCKKARSNTSSLYPWNILMVLDKRVSLLLVFLLHLELYICISSNGRTIECRMKSVGGGILRYDGLIALLRCLLRIWFASPIVSFCNICKLNNGWNWVTKNFFFDTRKSYYNNNYALLVSSTDFLLFVRQGFY